MTQTTCKGSSAYYTLAHLICMKCVSFVTMEIWNRKRGRKSVKLEKVITHTHTLNNALQMRHDFGVSAVIEMASNPHSVAIPSIFGLTIWIQSFDAATFRMHFAECRALSKSYTWQIVYGKLVQNIYDK